MRIGEGTIEEIKENGLAKVKVSRDFLYVACSACAGAEHVMIMAYNGLGAREGDRVRYEVDDSHLAMSSFICFIMPLLLAAAGARPDMVWEQRLCGGLPAPLSAWRLALPESNTMTTGWER